MIALADIVAAYQAERRADGLGPDPAPFAVANVALDKSEPVRDAHSKLAFRSRQRRERPVNLPVAEVDSEHTQSMTTLEKVVK